MEKCKVDAEYWQEMEGRAATQANDCDGKGGRVSVGVSRPDAGDIEDVQEGLKSNRKRKSGRRSTTPASECIDSPRLMAKKGYDGSGSPLSMNEEI